MLQIGRQYPSDLSDQQWELIKDLIPRARTGGRPRTTDLRNVVNAVFFLNRSGCAWRYLPKTFPPWKTVYDYFYRWKIHGVWKEIHQTLVARVRVQAGRDEIPSCAIVDSQSVKSSQGEHRAYDGFKRIKGRKRHILVDTLGLIRALRVHAANRHDQKEAHYLLPQLPDSWKGRLESILADQNYRGSFEEYVRMQFGFYPDIKIRPNSGQGRKKTTAEKLEWKKTRPSLLFPKRWIVERTFAWLGNYRRLSRDYEVKVSSSESMIYIAMSQLMIQRLVPQCSH